MLEVGKSYSASGKTIRKIVISRKQADCPYCRTPGCSRHSTKRRRLREIGETKPTELWVTVSVHLCQRCRKHFTLDIGYLADPSSRFTRRVKLIAVDFVRKLGWTLEKASREMYRRHFVRVPPTTHYYPCQLFQYLSNTYPGCR